MDTKTVKLYELKNAEALLSTMFNNQELPIQTAFKLSKLVAEISKQLTTLEDLRVRLVNKHGTVDETGNTVVLADKTDEFMQEMDAVLNEDVTIENVSLTEADLKGVKLSAVEILAVSKIITLEL